MITHYEVLGVTFHSNLEDIKRAYRERLLDVHPDKNNERKKLPTIVNVNAIQDAYRVLGNSVSRSKYDEEVVEAQKNSGYLGTGDGLDEYSLDEFEFDAENLRYCMNCPRCSAENGFSFNEETLESHAEEADSGDFQVLSQCSSCSLWLKVSFMLAAEEDE